MQPRTALAGGSGPSLSGLQTHVPGAVSECLGQAPPARGHCSAAEAILSLRGRPPADSLPPGI
eukprot:4021645-Prorocentrum_lima.AAC.1